MTIYEKSQLFDKISARVEREERKKALRSLGFDIFGMIVTFSFLVISVKAAWTGLNQSGFFSYLSLLFSDFKTIVPHWTDYAMSLLETMPVFEMMVISGSIFSLLLIIKLLIKNADFVFSKTKRLKSYGL